MLNSKAFDSDIVIRIKRRRKELWVDHIGGERLHGPTRGGKDIHTNFRITGRLYPRATAGTYGSATLPDYVLLEIFSFYVDGAHDEDEWHTLVHVCQTWRKVVFTSPRRLRLRLLCTQGRAAKKMLGVWPALPIIVKEYYAENLQLQGGVNNVVDALTYNDRIREINIQGVPSLLLEGIATMQAPFAALTSLALQSKDESPPALPDSFLGGCVPQLQELSFDGIPFLAVRKLLSSTKGLVSLRLWDIPPSGYISPEEMATSLSTLTKLKRLVLGFRSPRPQTDTEIESRHSPLLTRIVLPVLAVFNFKGNSEYLDDFVSRIDAPLLDNTAITLFNQLIFGTSQLRCFLGRTERFNGARRADVVFFCYRVQVSLFRQNGPDYHKIFELGISCATSDWQLSSLAQICSWSLPPVPALERLGIHEGRSSQPQWQDDVEDGEWAGLFRPFSTVTTLDISERFVGRVAPALQVLARRVSATDVLPALENIFLEGQQPPEPIYDAIRQFVAVRQRSGQLVTIHHRDRGRYWHIRDEVY